MELVAYSERDSVDPMTGAEGILRHEWHLSRTDKLDDALRTHFRPAHAWCVLSRYIRRDTVEPWRLYTSADTVHKALRDIGDRPIHAADPRFQVVLDEEAEHNRVYAEKLRKEKEDAARAEELRRLRGLRNVAFAKLLESKDGHIARAWNAFASSAKVDKAHLAKDERFMALYREAIETTTVPSKRKAMREALQYAGWPIQKGTAT